MWNAVVDLLRVWKHMVATEWVCDWKPGSCALCDVTKG